jgi:drug/metabolite transporter (DMT)-like permease
MIWFILALAGAVCNAGYSIAIKWLLKETDLLFLAAGTNLTASALLLLFSWVQGLPVIGETFWTAAAATIAINIVATVLYFKALEASDISLVTPMLSFTPAFLIITSFIILGEVPSMYGILGILLIVAGSLSLTLPAAGFRSLRSGDNLLKSQKGIIYMVIVAFLFSIAVNFDKETVLQSDVFFSSGFVLGILGLTFLLWHVFEKKSLVSFSKKEVWVIAAGIILAGEAITINAAYQSMLVPYVISVKRLSILFCILAGGIALQEPDLKKRLLFGSAMVAGAILIILTSSL